MNRIDKKLSDLKRKKQKALVVFLTAGDPSLKKIETLIPAMEKAGVDVVELGVPFSDPLADGAVIQASSQRALKRGVTLDGILRLVQRVRQKTTLPIALMSYLNPILHGGIWRFAVKAKRAGVDGVILPDVPPEEGKDISAVFRRSNLDLVYLLAPTSSSARQRMILKASRGFVYFVSVTGVTGARRKIPKDIFRMLSAIRRTSQKPVCVGFGISTPQQAKAMAKAADGVIVGSALVRALHDHPQMSAEAFCKKFIRPLARALGKKV